MFKVIFFPRARGKGSRETVLKVLTRKEKGEAVLVPLPKRFSVPGQSVASTLSGRGEAPTSKPTVIDDL
jgi:hypothetical protein